MCKCARFVPRLPVIVVCHIFPQDGLFFAPTFNFLFFTFLFLGTAAFHGWTFRRTDTNGHLGPDEVAFGECSQARPAESSCFVSHHAAASAT